MMDYQSEAQKLRDELIARRRDFHRHPELAFEEHRTAGIVADELRHLGLEVQTGVGQTGVVGILEGERDGATVLWRADMDALPIHELNEVEYGSTVPGKMHACGHDGHTTIALGVAKIFAQHRDKIAGRIKFVFQPAEEILGGAKAMIADGVLENPKPDVSLGLHLWNSMPFGKLGVVAGPMMAGSSRVNITIRGKGGHAAMPHTLHDPVVCAAHLIIALQTVISRNVDPMEAAVLSFGKVNGSDAGNIIPDTVEMEGTFRTFTLPVRDVVEARIKEISQNICMAMGCEADVRISHGTIPVDNHTEVVERVRDAFTQIVEPSQFIEERGMVSEDVALLMQDIPGMYFFVGSATDAMGYGHHHPRFDFDEEILPLAVALAASAIGAYVLDHD